MQPSQDLRLPLDARAGDGPRQQARRHARERVLRDGRVRQVPWLRLDAAAAARVGAVETEAPHVHAEPGGKPRERAAAPVFGDFQLRRVSPGHDPAVGDVDVGAPVMAARAGQRGPQQDRRPRARRRRASPCPRAGHCGPGPGARRGTSRSRSRAGARSRGRTRRARGRNRRARRLHASQGTGALPHGAAHNAARRVRRGGRGPGR